MKVPFCYKRDAFNFQNVISFFIRDLLRVYLNKCEFHFLQLHINKTNTCCFIIDNGRVPGMVNRQSDNLKHYHKTAARNTPHPTFHDFIS